MTKPAVITSFESPEKSGKSDSPVKAHDLEIKAKQQRIQKAILYENHQSRELM
jgi:hypothetical protein